MSREKTYIDEMNCAMIDEMSDAMVDDTKSNRRREFNDLGITGRPKVADSNKHSGGSHLCDEGSAHEIMERRRSVDYRTVNSERTAPPVAARRIPQQSSKSGGKGGLAIFMIILFIIGIADQSPGLIVFSIIILVLALSKKNNGSNSRK